MARDGDVDAGYSAVYPSAEINRRMELDVIASIAVRAFNCAYSLYLLDNLSRVKRWT